MYRLERRPGIEIIPISSQPAQSIKSSITITPINSTSKNSSSAGASSGEKRTGANNVNEQHSNSGGNGSGGGSNNNNNNSSSNNNNNNSSSSSNTGSSKRSESSSSDSSRLKLEKKRKRKREDSPMGPPETRPEKMPGKQQVNLTQIHSVLIDHYITPYLHSTFQQRSVLKHLMVRRYHRLVSSCLANLIHRLCFNNLVK